MSRKPGYSNDVIARRLKTIADTTRLGILLELMHGPKNVGALNAVLKVEPTLFSHHLKILRDEGLIASTPEGKTRLYQLTENVVASPAEHSIDLGFCRLVWDKSLFNGSNGGTHNHQTIQSHTSAL